ncbi:hypothetical protein ACHWQZ_G016986 [Mnemiopsis leidyi]
MATSRRWLDGRCFYKYFIIFSVLITIGLFVYLHLYFTGTSEKIVSSSSSSRTSKIRTKCQILIMILSTPDNSRNRQLLRWNSYLGYPWVFNQTDIDFKYVFILGKTNNSRTNELAIQESEQFGDIAIGNFKDSYSNLSEKVMWGFHYALLNFDFTFCFKVDEDSFVNVSYLAAHLSQVKPDSLPDFYAGKPRQGDLKVPTQGKFKLNSWENNQIDEYVQYNLGGGYILSQQAMSKVLSAHRSKAIEVLPWEDVYVGMLAYLVDMKPIRIYHYYVSRFYPFCTDSRSILLHHTQPELQARMLHHYHVKGSYCPKDMPEEKVMDLINSYDIVHWRDMSEDGTDDSL